MVGLIAAMCGWATVSQSLAATATYPWVRSIAPEPIGQTVTGVRVYSAVAGSNAVYIAGSFDSPRVDFGTVKVTNSTSTNIVDGFVARYTTNGVCEWARGIGGNDTKEPFSITVDGGGRVIVAGFFFSATATFGGVAVTNTLSGTRDMFVAAYSTNGQIQWARSAGGAANDTANAVVGIAGGGAYVVGGFGSTNLVAPPFVLANSDTDGVFSDAFLIRYTASGTVSWAVRGGGGDNSDEWLGVATMTNGDAVTMGYFISQTSTFGGLSVTNSANNTTADLVVARYDSTGGVIWVTHPTGDGEEALYRLGGISVDFSNQIYVAADFVSGTLTWGSNTLINSDGSAFTGDAFLAKLDPSGIPQWMRRIGETDYDDAFNVCTSIGSNGVLVAGSFSSEVLDLDGNLVTSLGDYDVMFIRYDADGSVLWYQLGGGPGYDDVFGVTGDVRGVGYAAGVALYNDASYGGFNVNGYPGAYGSFVLRLQGASVVPFAPPLTILSSGPQVRTNGFRMSFPTTSGLNYRVQFSTNLTSWSTRTNVAGNGSTFEFADPVPGTVQKRAYYRVYVD
jgi:hypothetical protein